MPNEIIKFAFIERIRYTTFAYSYLDSATFGYSFATKNALLSTDKGAFFYYALVNSFFAVFVFLK